MCRWWPLQGAMLATILLATARPAAADPGMGGAMDALLVLVPIGAGYVGETIGFAIGDYGGGPHGLGYGTTEAALNIPIASAFAFLTYDQLGDDSKLAGIFGTLAVINGVLAYDGVSTMVDSWPTPVATWSIIAGCADAAQLMAFTTYDVVTPADGPDRVGILEAAVNGPIAIGLGYLAYDTASASHAGPTIVLGGGAVLSTALTIHGIRAALRSRPQDVPAHALRIVPTLVGDGRAMGFGLGIGGRL